MKSLSLIVAFVLATSFAFGQSVWSLDKGHSKVGFTVSHHMISEVDGVFKNYTAKFTATKEDFSDAVFEFSAETASLNTENEARDKHLKSADIFDVEKFPAITFKSTSFAKIMGNKWKATGDLTMKDVTLPVSLELWVGGPEKNDRAKRFEVGIKAIGKLSRNAFGVGKNLPTLMVGDDVELRILGEFNKLY
jgi:polyisoprenoid-binding protein YceI